MSEVKTNKISSLASNNNITLEPDGTGVVNLADNDKLTFGAGSDLQIYHDGSSSFIADVGTGNLTLLANEFRLNNSGNTENMITAAPDGAVTLFHNDSAKIATTSTGVTISGNNPGGKIRLEMGQTGVANGDVTGEIQFYQHAGS